MQKEQIEQHLLTAEQELSAADNLTKLELIKSKYVGKNGIFTNMLKSLANLDAMQKPLVGKLINTAKEQFLVALAKQLGKIHQGLIQVQLKSEAIDLTLPGLGQAQGRLHPITQVRQRMEELFTSLGFLVLGEDDAKFNREIEDEFHNFDALNIPYHHPSRGASDTFYLQESNYLLRTQTSPAQIRAMEILGAPLRVVVPGKVYRRDFDATHSPMFNQLEILVVSETASFGELKGLMHDFLQKFFEREKIELRFRPSYFPFTEPSAEIDLQCLICNGKGCKICKGSGWIEVGGCGMVHPNVLTAAKVDNEKFTGFAFGLGIDRFAMFRYGIDDLRLMFENDLRFLEQF